MKYTLTEEREASSAIPHTFNQLELIHFSLNHTITLLQSQASFHRRLIALNPQDEALEASDVASSDFCQSGVEPLSCSRSQHVDKLLHQVIG